MKLINRIFTSIATLLLLAGSAVAAPIVLDFEGINATYPTTNFAYINNFYNGGTSNQGTSGTNYGVSFSSNALAISLNTPGNFPTNTSRNGLGNPASAKGALFFLSGAQTYMNDANGFDTGFSFNYTAIYQTGSVSVYDGLNGTGNLLATLSLPLTTSHYDPNYRAGFAPFYASGISFNGIAKSVSFAGVANQIVFDDVTFGSATPGGQPVPEPSTFILLGAGLAGLGFVRRKLRK